MPAQKTKQVARGQNNIGMTRRGHSRLEDLFSNLAAFLVLAMMVLTVGNALGRYVFQTPVPGTNEILSLYMMLPMIWLATPYVQREGANVAVDIVMRRTPIRVQRLVFIVTALLASFLFVYIAKESFETGLEALGRRTAGVVRIPTAPPYFVVTLGAGLLALRLLIDAFREGRLLLGGYSEVGGASTAFGPSPKERSQ